MKLVWGAMAAVALIAAAPAGSDGDAMAYRLRLVVQPVAGATVQRLALPGAVLVAAQREDLSDLRLFDARGRSMPIARSAVSAPAVRRDTLPALPILGAADALNVTGVSLKLDDSGRARVATVDGTLPARGGSTILGVLLDARAIAGAANSVTLDADLPVAQPVTFSVEASRDLKSWRALAEQVVYRARADGGAPTVTLDGAIDRDYIRLTWRGATRLLTPVVVRGATLATLPGGDAALTRVTALLTQPIGGKTIDLAIPFATPIAAIGITPAGDDLIVPVRILGRQNREQPWTLLGAGTAARDATRDITLSGTAFAQLRIEADARTAGFTVAPKIMLGFAPRDILFHAAGPSPFTLAVGRAGAVDTYLPRESLTDRPDAVPRAAVTTPAGFVLPLDPAGNDGASGRTSILWAILVAATALLGVMAWLLWKRGIAPADHEPTAHG